MEIKMSSNYDVSVYMPNDEIIPTRLSIRAGGKYVYYWHTLEGFGYDFEVLGLVSDEEAVDIVKQLAKIMENQSYDHGARWETVSIYLVEQDDRYKIAPIVRVMFRKRDAG